MKPHRQKPKSGWIGKPLIERVSEGGEKRGRVSRARSGEHTRFFIVGNKRMEAPKGFKEGKDASRGSTKERRTILSNEEMETRVKGGSAS